MISLAFSPDSEVLVSAGSLVDLWDTRTGEHQGSLNSYNGAPTDVAFSSKGALAAGYASGYVVFWDWRTRKLSFRLKHGAGVGFLSFSSDGNTLLCSAGRNYLWDLTTRKASLSEAGYSIAPTPDGNEVALSDYIPIEKINYAWISSLQTGKRGVTFVGLRNWIRSMVFSADGKTLFAGSDGGGVIVWARDTGKPLFGSVDDLTGPLQSPSRIAANKAAVID